MEDAGDGDRQDPGSLRDRPKASYRARTRVLELTFPPRSEEEPASYVPLPALGDERVHEHGVDVDRPRLSLHQQLALWLDGDPVLERAARVLADQDRPVQHLSVRLEASS